MSTPIGQLDTLKLRMYSTMGNQASVNTFYYVPVVGSVVGNWTTDLLALVWSTFVAPLVKPQQAILSHYDGASCQIVTGKPYSAVVYSNAGAGNGTATLNPLPSQVSGMISRITAFSGRSYRGRIYMPFPTATHSDTNGVPTLTYQTLLSTFAADVEPPAGLALTSGSNTIQLLPVIWHKKANLGLTPITGHSVPLRWGTQRRRGSYGRPNFKPSGL